MKTVSKNGEALRLLDHAPFVRSISLGLVSDEHEAADLAQDTFLAALERPPADLGNPRGWLSAVAGNLARRGFRTRKRRAARLHAATQRDARAPSPSPAELIASRDLACRVVDLLLRLDEPYRSTLIERFYGGRSAVEIAREAGIPVETVRTRLKRGLRILRNRLDASEDRNWRAALLPFLCVDPSGKSGVDIDLVSGTESTSSTFLSWAGAIVVVVVTVVALAGLFADGERSVSKGRGDSVAAPPSGISASADRAATASGDESDQQPVSASGSGAPSPVWNPPSIEVRLLWPGGEEPAKGVRGRLVSAADLERGDVLPAGQEMDLISDPDGVLSVPSVDAGDYVLEIDRVTEERWPRIALGPGERESTTFELPRGVDVEVTVLDSDGVPMVAADVVLATWLRISDRGVVLGRTDHQGRFEVRALSRNGYLGARRTGRASSPLLHIDGSGGTGAESLILMLGGEESRVFGSVIDPTGSAVPGAHIVVEMAGNPIEIETGGMQPGPWESWTDDGGCFSTGGLSPGKKEVLVLTSGAFAPYYRIVGGDGMAPVELRLEEAASLECVIIDSEGAPVSAASITVVDSATGQLRWPIEVTTDVDGRFSVAGLAPGAVRIDARRQGLRASRSLEVEAGPNRQWIHLEASSVLRGRVVDEQGRPRAGYRVEAWRPLDIPRTEEESPGITRVVHRAHRSPPEFDRMMRLLERVGGITGSDGSFVLGLEEDVPHRVDVYGPPGTADVPLAMAENVRPSSGEVVFRIDSIPAGRVVAFVENWHDLRGECKAVLLSDEPGLEPVPSPPFVADRAVFEGVPEGKYSLVLSSSRRGTLVGASFDVLPGDEVDLGVIRLREPGSLFARLIPSGSRLVENAAPDRVMAMPGSDPSLRKGLRFKITTPDGRPVVDARQDDRVVTAGPLQPGCYLLVAEAVVQSCWGCAAVPFDVFAGEEAVVDLTLESGWPCEIEKLTRAADDASRLVELRLLGEDGCTILRLHGGETYRLLPGVPLAPGAYILRWRRSSGAAGEVTLDVSRDSVSPR